MYVYIIVVVVIIIVVVIVIVNFCHGPIFAGSSPVEPMVIPSSQASSFILQYLLYYV
jgi:hypothetical protein